jgi:RsiW-degrading membrane proteinase PrsW (M82 family)
VNAAIVATGTVGVMFAAPSQIQPAAPPGWYKDPWQAAELRWWDGYMWTSLTRKSGTKAMLPPWISWPVVILAPLVLLFVGGIGVVYPVATLMTVFPAIIVLTAIWWLDRVEPEPIEAKVHAVLWGATVATTIAGLVNSGVALMFGETAAAVISAPVAEEVLKAIGVYWVARRGRIRTTLDGVVYAGLVAGGFALTENVQYFASGAKMGALLEVFVLRGLLTPFAHPLFTLWTGVGIGLAARKRRGVRIYDFWGLPLAIGLHSLWNGMIAWGSTRESSSFVGLPWMILGLFVAIFLGCASVLVVTRIKTAGKHSRLIGQVALHYHLDPVECRLFSSWRSVKAARSLVPWKKRRNFDSMHSAVIRLMEHHDAGHGPESAGELVHALNEARRVNATERGRDQSLGATERHNRD